VPPRPGSIETIVAWCLEVHDLVLAKCVAGREPDWDYATEALRFNIVSPETLLTRVPDLPVGRKVIESVAETLGGVIERLEVHGSRATRALKTQPRRSSPRDHARLSVIGHRHSLLSPPIR
jgi:hypothetical protein